MNKYGSNGQTVFPLSKYISRSTSTYWALWNGKIKTQTSYWIYIYMWYGNYDESYENGWTVLCASKELWIKMYAHSVRIDKIWSNFIGWVWYINMYPSIWSFNIPLSQQPPQAFEVLKISLFLGPKCCSNSPLKVLDLIVNFCKRQLIVSAIFLFGCTSDL